MLCILLLKSMTLLNMCESFTYIYTVHVLGNINELLAVLALVLHAGTSDKTANE